MTSFKLSPTALRNAPISCALATRPPMPHSLPISANRTTCPETSSTIPISRNVSRFALVSTVTQEQQTLRRCGHTGTHHLGAAAQMHGQHLYIQLCDRLDRRCDCIW